MDETLKYRIWDGKQAGYISSGGEIFLHSGESVIISGLPAGTKYTVTERQEEGWYVTPASGTVSGEIIRVAHAWRNLSGRTGSDLLYKAS